MDKMGFTYKADSPDVDETPAPGEQPKALVQRLAVAKATHVANNHHHALIIGSDQVATVGDSIFGKPLTHVRACEQLEYFSGKRITFYNGLCLLDTDNDAMQTAVIPFSVQFRPFSNADMQAYLNDEKPYHCAGSFKSEGQGAMLCEKFIGDDPNALIGLPVMALVRMLKNVGYPIFS